MAKLDFSKLKTYPLKKRQSKVKTGQLGRLCRPGASIGDFLDSLPDVFAAKNLKRVAKAIVQAKRKGKPVIFGIGGHVIKCGLSPVLIELMRKGWISSIAMNGSTAIHDFEMAFAGQTSEDVDEALSNGSFGMAEETGRLINEALIEGSKKGLGAGETLALTVSRGRHYSFKNLSVLAQSEKLKVPVTIHIAVGTDIIHQHPVCQGEAIGKTSMADFRRFCSTVADMNGGGVFVNFGSNVILPEVFLKALSVARNLKGKVSHFTTANFDMIRHYRPYENIVRRPVLEGGDGFYIIGHHEILLPLLACAVQELGRKK